MPDPRRPDWRRNGWLTEHRSGGYRSTVEYATGERELYDLHRDPFQLDNIAYRADTALVRRLSAWLKALTTRVDAQCRSAEDRLPR